MKAYTSYALRPATSADISAIADLWYRGWLDAHLGRVPDALVEHRRPEHFTGLAASRIPLTTVAKDGDRVIGFVTVHDDEVEQIYVDADARGVYVSAVTTYIAAGENPAFHQQQLVSRIALPPAR